MQVIQQGSATAAYRRVYFRLIDSTDGESGVTGATVTIAVRKNGGASAAGAGTTTELSDGLYYYEAAAAEVDTLGSLLVIPSAAGAYTYAYEVLVVEYDPFAAPETSAEVATAVRTELTTELGRIDVASSTLATAAALATVDTNVDAVLVDTGTDIPATLATLATAANLATVDTNVDAILVDTGTDLPATLSAIAGYIDTEVAAILVDTGTDIPALISALNALVTAIKAKTDSLTFTVAGQVDANMQSVNDVTLSGDGTTTPMGAA